MAITCNHIWVYISVNLSVTVNPDVSYCYLAIFSTAYDRMLEVSCVEASSYAKVEIAPVQKNKIRRLVVIKCLNKWNVKPPLETNTKSPATLPVQNML